MVLWYLRVIGRVGDDPRAGGMCSCSQVGQVDGTGAAGLTVPYRTRRGPSAAGDLHRTVNAAAWSPSLVVRSAVSPG